MLYWSFDSVFFLSGDIALAVGSEDLVLGGASFVKFFFDFWAGERLG